MRFCSLASGSSGNCQYIGNEHEGLLVDAGLSGKYIKGALEAINVDMGHIKGILITHEHTDHIKGVGVLARRFHIPAYMTQGTYDSIKESLKLQDDDVRIIEKGVAYSVGDMCFKAFSVSHDAVDPIGFTVVHEAKKISVVTDLGHMTESIINEISDSDLLLLESNHDVEMLKMGKYPFYLKKRILSEVGHLSNDAAAEVALEIILKGKTKNILLGHLSKDNNFPDLAMETMRERLAREDICMGVDVNVGMTYRDRISGLYTIRG